MTADAALSAISREPGRRSPNTVDVVGVVQSVCDSSIAPGRFLVDSSRSVSEHSPGHAPVRRCASVSSR